MPGLRKTEICRRILKALLGAGWNATSEGFVGPSEDLPWLCAVTLSSGAQRRYRMYFWTVGHGGRARPRTEYRIQTKLKVEATLQFGSDTTVLLGYYHRKVDVAGVKAGNEPPDGMEVFVAWDPVKHLRPGASSSCQVPFSTLYDAYLVGLSSSTRKVADGTPELVLSFRPEYLAAYLLLAGRGHETVTRQTLEESIGTHRHA